MITRQNYVFLKAYQDTFGGVILVEPSLRPSRAALELPYNASLATVGGKEFDGSATDDITVLQQSSYRTTIGAHPCNRRTFGERHGCTKGPVPLSLINLRMSTDKGLAAVLRSVRPKLPESFERFKTSVALLRLGLPCNFLDAALTFPS